MYHLEVIVTICQKGKMNPVPVFSVYDSAGCPLQNATHLTQSFHGLKYHNNAIIT